MIPLFRPSVSELEIQAVTGVLKSGWWGMGPVTEAFEHEFAASFEPFPAYAVAVNSGTAALELAARALGVKHGTVVTTALTFVSTAQAMQHAGNDVIFADIDEETLCVDWRDVQEKLSFIPSVWSMRNSPPRARAVVPVWYGGTVTKIPDWLRDSDVKVIEDCAHAAGSPGAGVYGDAAAWSFHAVKNLATGDGGMITTPDSDVAAKLRCLRWCGIDRSTWEREDAKKGYGWDYDIPGDGEKAHMNDITAALGRAQLRRLSELNARRRNLLAVYERELRPLSWLRVPLHRLDSANHLFVVRVPARDRDRFIDHALAAGVSAGVHYKPLTHYKALFPWTMPLPVTERVWKTLVTLPLYPDMTEGEQSQVIGAVKTFRPSSPEDHADI